MENNEETDKITTSFDVKTVDDILESFDVSEITDEDFNENTRHVTSETDKYLSEDQLHEAKQASPSSTKPVLKEKVRGTLKKYKQYRSQVNIKY